MQVAVVELEGIKRAFSNSTSEISESEEIIVGVGEIPVLERSTGPRTAWGGGTWGTVYVGVQDPNGP